MRRQVETAWAQQGGKLLVLELALDWAKAFDSVDPEAMIAALGRFGLPAHILQIQAIYTDRVFQVAESGGVSPRRSQHSGISQGCPPSHHFFS